MAPPLPPSADNPLKNGPPGEPPLPGEMSLAWINRLLPHYFELGTVYTMIAGLLNILAVYDACCGPVPAESVAKQDEKSPGQAGSQRGEVMSSRLLVRIAADRVGESRLCRHAS